MSSIHENQRCVILHGHFYQPPRENPWLGFIEPQPSAAPFRHWTERITEECYRANAWSPLLARGGRLAELVNNYAHLSFNAGPTLLDWLEPNAPDVFRRMVEGDRAGACSRGGHGNALAQGYNHAILPLCSRRDKETQVRWGVEDFRRRFGRRPEGIWLPETAVDLETVEVLIEQGLRYTVLAPSQLLALRPLGSHGEWLEVDDPAGTAQLRPCRVFGRDRDAGHLDVFFFHPEISREISFNHLLRDGPSFAARLEQAFDDDAEGGQALVVATDGETFGHHEAFGDMCLSWLFSQPPKKLGFRLTNFGEFLERFPPLEEALLQPGPDGEGTAWSCAHGVGRWARDCGCATGAGEGWNQQWRGPLREGLNTLRRRISEVLEREGHTPALPLAGAPADASRRARDLDELHYYGQLMFTSCAWFFNDISGLEPVQNLFYARRAAELLESGFGVRAEAELLRMLARARSNLRSKGSGAQIYRRDVLPRTLDREGLVAAAALLAAHGIEHPLGRNGEFSLERLAVERLNRGALTLEAGWSRLRNRLRPATHRPYLHLVLHTADGTCRVWAKTAERGKAETAYRNLLASLARFSEDEIRGNYRWRFHAERRLPWSFRDRLEAHFRKQQKQREDRLMIALHGEGRDLFLRAAREERAAGSAGSRPASRALSLVFADTVARALPEGGDRTHRPARRLRRMALALGLELDMTPAEAVLHSALADELGHADLLRTPGPARRAIRLARLGQRLGLDPSGDRGLQVRFWDRLEAAAGPHGTVADLPNGLLRLGELLGYHRRSLIRRFKGTRD